MFFKQFFDKKLAQTSYMVACQKTQEAIIIDPKRVIDEYQEVAEAEGFNITQVAETTSTPTSRPVCVMRHNASTPQLMCPTKAMRTGNMKICQKIPSTWKDGDIINVGNVELKVIHTPGHTPESISFVLIDRGGGSDEPMGIFTGDFIFVGDIGRPDLLEEAAKMEGTTEEGANAMFASLKKMNDYPDFMQVWPGHGAGSACGKSSVLCHCPLLDMSAK